MRRAMLPIALAIVIFSACRGGSSTKATVSANKSATTTAGGTTATASGDTATTKAPSFSGSSNSNYCDTARRIEATAKANPSTDLKSSYQQLDKVAAQFIAIAPSAIKADAQTLIDGLKKLEKALAAANYDFTKVDPSTLAALQDPNFAAAAERISAYDKQVCGLPG